MNKGLKTFLTGYGVENSQLKYNIFERIMRFLFVGGIIFTTIAAILGKSPYAVATYTATTIYYGFNFIMNKKIKKDVPRQILYILFCIINNSLLYPFLYITGGGIDSGMPTLMILGGVIDILILDNITMVVTLLLNSVSFMVAYVMEINNPDFIHSFTELGTRTYADISMSSVIVGFGIGLVLRRLTLNFDANQAEASKLLKQIEESSTKDPLTGAYNRRYLMEYIDKCIMQTANGEMRTFSLLMFDIDHFKHVNDTYGHLAGDDCIKNLAYVLKNNLRNVDVVSRYGGEEFICVLPTADDTPAFRRAEQIRASIEITQLSNDIDKKVTISGGVAMYMPGMTAEELIHAVDENLYLAKENGRNQIVWHNGGIPPLCYVAYDSEVLHPVKNSGRRFSDMSGPPDILPTV